MHAVMYALGAFGDGETVVGILRNLLQGHAQGTLDGDRVSLYTSAAHHAVEQSTTETAAPHARRFSLQRRSTASLSKRRQDLSGPVEYRNPAFRAFIYHCARKEIRARSGWGGYRDSPTAIPDFCTMSE